MDYNISKPFQLGDLIVMDVLALTFASLMSLFIHKKCYTSVSLML